MVRCPQCGRRLRQESPICPTHGCAPCPVPSPEQAPPFEVPEPRLAGYDVLRKIGQGGFGAVFEAIQRSDGARVAIKVARADQASSSARLLREARALAAIGPPHVPAVYGHGRLPGPGEGGGPAYLVMEYVVAPTLADLLERAGEPTPIDAFSRTALAVVRAVEAAHACGLAHCDLKPENLFVDEAFGAKLFDFGLVRRISGAALDATTDEGPAGTPEYMSPEQCDGTLEIDARSDVYAVGVILYELLAGAPPFWGNPAEVQQQHRSHRPPMLGARAAIPAALEEAVMKCLAKDVERRFSDLGSLRAALERALDGGGVPEPRRAQPSGASASQATSTKATTSARERRSVALVFFETKATLVAVRDALAAVGGQLANVAGAQVVVAFGHEMGDNPVRGAVAAAEAFISRGLCRRALVELAQVSIQQRPDGTRRFQSPLFAKKELYGAPDAVGVQLAPAAAEVLPDYAWVGPDRAHEEAHQRTTTRISVAPLVGRDDLLREILQAARAATGTPLPTITTVVGDAGIGKTHLAATLVQQLESLAPPHEVLLIRAKEVLGGAADQTTREILIRALGLPLSAPPDLGRQLLTERLGPGLGREVWAGVAVAMGWAPPEHPELRALAAAPGALRSAPARAAGEALRLLARRGPLAVVVEDAHFADETALDALEYAALKEAGCPIWICVIGRPSFGHGRTAWAGRAAARQHLTLGPLDGQSAAELARRLLAPAESVPLTALARLAERTQGIPLLLVELVRGLKRDGLVRRSEKGSSWYLATDGLDRLPDLPLVQWLASRETESLAPELAAHARLASILGSELTSEELDGVIRELERAGVRPETQLDAGVGLQRLVESGLLIRHRQGRVGFRHALLRDTVYQSVPPGERGAIHLAAYDYFRGHGGLEEEDRLRRMAFHAARSGIREEAARLYLTLAERTAARHSYLDAELLYRNARENLSETDDAAHIRVGEGLGIMRFRLGRHQDALKEWTAARARAERIGDRRSEIVLLLHESEALDWLNDWEQARDRVDRASALAVGDLRTPPIVAQLLLATARVLHRSNDTEVAIAFFEGCIDACERVGDEVYESLSHSLSLLAFSCAVLGRVEKAERTFERAVQVFEAHGDLIGLAVVMHNRFVLWLITDNVPRLLEDARRAQTIAREAGFTLLESQVTKDLGEIQYLLGQGDDAERSVLRAMEIYRQTLDEDSRLVSQAHLLIARIQLFRGELAAAREGVERLRARQEAAIAAGRADAQLIPGEVILLDMVDYALTSAPAERWRDLVARARELTVQPQDVVEILEMHGLTALRAGRVAEGREVIEAALDEARRNAPLLTARIERDLAGALAA